MHEEIKDEYKENLVTKEKSFPWLSLIVLTLAVTVPLTIEILTLNINETEALMSDIPVDPTLLRLGLLYGIIIGIISMFIGIAIQYAFIKFPTQWISQEKNVYQNEIWEALFYSATIKILLERLFIYLNFQGNIVLDILISIGIMGIFLLIYFSGQQKEPKIKKAMIIAQIIWIVLGIGAWFLLNLFISNLMT